MDIVTTDPNTPLAEDVDAPLVKPDHTDDEDSKNNDDDDLDMNDFPQIKIDKRASNFIQRRHSADLKNLDNRIQIKITGPSSIPDIDVTNDMDDQKGDSKYFEGSDNEDDALHMLGQPKQIIKTQSLDTGLSQRKEQEFKLSDELQNLSTKQASIVTIEETDNISGKTVIQRAVVPPRQVIDRYPFFSTPLTVESTNNAFRDFMSRLTDMGFREQAEAALVHTNAESIELAVAFITEHPDRLWHRFVLPSNDFKSTQSNNALLTSSSDSLNNSSNDNRNNNNNENDIHITDNALCDACGMAYIEHIIDHRGEQIIAKDEALYGDLGGRVSMSVATLKERQDQKSLQETINHRVHILNSLTVSEEDGLAIDSSNNNGLNSSLTMTLSDKIKSEIDNVMKEDLEKKKTIDGPTETCMICFDDKSVNDFYKAPCGHNYCKDCLQAHYKVKTKDGDVLKVSCIDPSCDREIPEEECRQFLTDPDILAKYNKFRREKLIMLNPSARFCPKPDCEGHMTGSRWNPKLTCPVCSEEVCFNCSQHWHGYFVGCNQNVDIGYSRWAIGKDVQKCPKCRMGIEKSEGCNHMTCQNCQYQFCWICRGPYSSSHFDPWNIFGCPGAQFTPRFCRCPSCFPRWLNRILILIFFFAVIVPLVITAGTLWLVVLFLVFCIRCDAKCDIDPCDCFD